MAFGQSSGQPLAVGQFRAPKITDLSGATFMVNGRAFSGTGVGYNPLAVGGPSRALTALENIQMGASPAVYPPVALMPNSVVFLRGRS